MFPVSMFIERLFVIIFCPMSENKKDANSLSSLRDKKLQVSKKLLLSPPKKIQAEGGFFLRERRL